jgi:ribosomal protein L30E
MKNDFTSYRADQDGCENETDTVATGADNRGEESPGKSESAATVKTNRKKRIVIHAVAFAAFIVLLVSAIVLPAALCKNCTGPLGGVPIYIYDGDEIDLGRLEGKTGPQGEKGEKGDAGAQGAQGEKGETGAQGEKG